MMTENERQTIFAAIYSIMTIKGKPENFENPTRYTISLPYASLTYFKLPKKNQLIEITEHYGRDIQSEHLYQERFYNGFIGTRKLYRGSIQCLEEVALQGFYPTSENGETIPPAEKILRFYDSTDGRKPRREEKETFDSWLKYALKELTNL